eukprot:350205-Rhodomonas_salina.1
MTASNGLPETSRLRSIVSPEKTVRSNAATRKDLGVQRGESEAGEVQVAAACSARPLAEQRTALVSAEGAVVPARVMHNPGQPGGRSLGTHAMPWDQTIARVAAHPCAFDSVAVAALALRLAGPKVAIPCDEGAGVRRIATKHPEPVVLSETGPVNPSQRPGGYAISAARKKVAACYCSDPDRVPAVRLVKIPEKHLGGHCHLPCVHD